MLSDVLIARAKAANTAIAGSLPMSSLNEQEKQDLGQLSYTVQDEKDVVRGC